MAGELCPVALLGNGECFFYLFKRAERRIEACDEELFVDEQSRYVHENWKVLNGWFVLQGNPGCTQTCQSLRNHFRVEAVWLLPAGVWQRRCR